MPKRFEIRAPPEWGIEPVPKEHKILRGIDLFVLWSSLGVGLLVLVAGSLLVPGLSLIDAFVVSLIGSLIGSALLAAAGIIGSEYSIPTMVSLRPILGKSGSYIPTALNVIQLIGWTAFELMIMGAAAANISGPILGSYTRIFWTIIFAIWCAALAIGGPLVFVRKWLERVAIWLVYLSTIWITLQVLTRPETWSLFMKPGDGTLPMLLALDLV
ncbi:MAG: putative hydroxymethylpyrimidine transporter CytX, partial [Thaumarchaeota archaeon]